MSRWYARASVSTLNWINPPWSTLMSVAKPWIDALPAPLTSHSLGGLPTLVFSHATGLTMGGSHGAACATGARAAPSSATDATASAEILHADLRSGMDGAYGARNRMTPDLRPVMRVDVIGIR